MARTVAAAPELAGNGQIPLTQVLGLGQATQEKLKARNITCLQDLWLWLPLRYEDRTQLTAITSLQVGTAAQVEGQVSAVHTSFRSRPMLKQWCASALLWRAALKCRWAGNGTS